ncbi:50S ribosome-binding GTPase [Lelliottia sp. V106_10]|uniref:GTPase n=1 Tax=Lelliottia wanjuensis TaxID=3050585 RepID=UPI00254D3EEE|nr:MULTISPECIES: GTPase [unclassified Lelliottia]MDK9354838.1 50S ribosome-binding GTPase [Lelliottia sp. V106_16]MDK9372045.1 50S ribosome-binding GTPase [Lelliottia sp. V106_10]MDK9598682.1 50S ribosome-binding GTPase [Lelliottia sp. V106_5]
MFTPNALTETDLLHRILTFHPESAEPLVKYLKIEKEVDLKAPDKHHVAELLINHARKMGGHELANLCRKGEGIPYAELVYDVGKKMKVPDISKINTVEGNERLIIKKALSDAVDKMSPEEREKFLASVGLENRNIPVGPAGAIVVQMLLAQLGAGALSYIALLLTEMLSVALLGRVAAWGALVAVDGMVANAAGVLLGPVGWFATGAWLANDLAGPAYRKTVPFVIHFAALRQLVNQQINLCVVGDGSTGKDSLMRQVFGITGKINPVAGITSSVESHQLKNCPLVWVHNLPGFNDPRASVNQRTDDFLHVADAFLVVVDLNRGISDVDIQVIKHISTTAPGKPLLICLNKIDLLRPDADIAVLEQVAKKRLGNYPMLKTAFDPDPRLGQAPLGAHDIFVWICEQLEASGKDVSQLRMSGLQ